MLPPPVALIVYLAGIIWIFRMNRDKMPASPALWIPVAWIAIAASRTVTEWFGGVSGLRSPDQYLDGSPLDAAIFAALEIAAVMVLVSRHPRTGQFLRANGPLIVFFAYCLVSVMWSDFPLTAAKRWTKAVGNLLMVLVVFTDPAGPTVAVRRFLARVGFVLIPLSILFIKYFPELGRGFSQWTGAGYNAGVAYDKNGLGIICLIFGLGTLWRFVVLLERPERPRPRRMLVANGVIVLMTLYLLRMADSATSLGCFAVGAAMIVLTGRRKFSLPVPAVHIVAVLILVGCLFALLVDTDVGLVQAMGRDPTLTTRTQLWEDVLKMPVNPLFGAGFESFWLGDRAKTLWRKHWWHPNQAHNGYIEIYLNLGWLGLIALALVIVWGYRNVILALDSDRTLGRLRLGFFLAALLYNFTEAAFKAIHPVWIAFMMAVVLVPEPKQVVQHQQVFHPRRMRTASPSPSARRV